MRIVVPSLLLAVASCAAPRSTTAPVAMPGRTPVVVHANAAWGGRVQRVTLQVDGEPVSHLPRASSGRAQRIGSITAGAHEVRIVADVEVACSWDADLHETVRLEGTRRIDMDDTDVLRIGIMAGHAPAPLEQRIRVTIADRPTAAQLTVRRRCPTLADPDHTEPDPREDATLLYRTPGC